MEHGTNPRCDWTLREKEVLDKVFKEITQLMKNVYEIMLDWNKFVFCCSNEDVDDGVDNHVDDDVDNHVDDDDGVHFQLEIVFH